MDLKQILKEQGVTQTQLADMLGVSKQYVNNLVSGRQDPGLQMFRQISALINVPLWRFFYEEPEAAPEITGIIKAGNTYYEPKSASDLRQIADTIEKSAETAK